MTTIQLGIGAGVGKALPYVFKVLQYCFRLRYRPFVIALKQICFFEGDLPYAKISSAAEDPNSSLLNPS